MTERNTNNTQPRLRPGEQLPILPDGFVPTRVNGKIIGVSEPKQDDALYGKSGYTVRQVREIDGIRFRIKTGNLTENESITIL